MSSVGHRNGAHLGSFIPAGYDKRLMVAAGRASLDLGAKIAERLGVGLTDAGLKTFSDGEVYCRYAESIRGADLFIVQSICGSEREGLTVNDALMELLLMVHAAKHASAHRIIAVTPWYGYSRQDKKSAPREPISGAAGRRAARRPRASTAWSRWTCTPARCRASSRSRSTT